MYLSLELFGIFQLGISIGICVFPTFGGECMRTTHKHLSGILHGQYPDVILAVGLKRYH